MAENGGNIICDYRFDPSLELTIFTPPIINILNHEINKFEHIQVFSLLDSNESYEDFLHGSIDYFNSIGDFDSAILCQQQLMMVDYCDNYDIDFCSTFFG